MSVVRFKSGDTRPFDVGLTANQTPVNLTGVIGVRFHMKPRVLGPTIDQPAQVLDAVKGLVRYVWQTGDLDVPGLYSGEFEVTFGDNTIETFPNGENISIQVVEALG